MAEKLAPKWVECSCGHRFEATRSRTWCSKCCRPVFYSDKGRRGYRLNNFYMMGVVALTIMLITYFFIEIVAVPLLG